MDLGTCERFFARTGISPRQVLGLPEKGQVTERQITEAYRRKALEHHPDRAYRRANSDPGAEADAEADDQAMKLVNTAYKYEWDMLNLAKEFDNLKVQHTFQGSINIERSSTSKPWLSTDRRNISVLDNEDTDSEDDEPQVGKQMICYERLKPANSVLDDTYASSAMILQTSDGSQARFQCPIVPRELRATYVPKERTPKEKIIDMPMSVRASDLKRPDIVPVTDAHRKNAFEARLMQSIIKDRERADRILLSNGLP